MWKDKQVNIREHFEHLHSCTWPTCEIRLTRLQFHLSLCNLKSECVTRDEVLVLTIK